MTGEPPPTSAEPTAELPLITEIEPGSELADILAGAMTLDGRPLNIFAVLAHHPKLLKRFNLMGGFLLNKGLVPDRERELVILRVGWNAQSVYEFGQHTLIGQDAGLTDAEITAVTLPATDHAWSDDDSDLLALADELCADDKVSADTLSRLAQRWSPAQLVELVICAGFYRLVSGFLNTMGVPLDDGVPGWPDRAP